MRLRDGEQVSTLAPVVESGDDDAGDAASLDVGDVTDAAEVVDPFDPDPGPEAA